MRTDRIGGRFRAYAVAFGCLDMAAACGGAAPPPDTACTAIGAAATLTVVVTDVAPTESVRVTAVARGTAPRAEGAGRDTASGTCVGAACAAGVMLYRFAPDTATLTIATRARIERVVVPRYKFVYPNGRECPPAIRAGRVAVPAGG